jgi:hypothetical protein
MALVTVELDVDFDDRRDRLDNSQRCAGLGQRGTLLDVDLDEAVGERDERACVLANVKSEPLERGADGDAFDVGRVQGAGHERPGHGAAAEEAVAKTPTLLVAEGHRGQCPARA